jgi:hypothetical protein
MPTKLCSGTTTNGTACRGVALAGYSLCRHHQQLQRRSRRQLRAQRDPAIRLGSLHSHDAILRNLSRVAQAIAANALNLDRATAFLATLQRATDTLALTEGFPLPVPDLESWNMEPGAWLPKQSPAQTDPSASPAVGSASRQHRPPAPPPAAPACCSSRSGSSHKRPHPAAPPDRPPSP